MLKTKSISCWPHLEIPPAARPLSLAKLIPQRAQTSANCCSWQLQHSVQGPTVSNVNRCCALIQNIYLARFPLLFPGQDGPIKRGQDGIGFSKLPESSFKSTNVTSAYKLRKEWHSRSPLTNSPVYTQTRERCGTPLSPWQAMNFTWMQPAPIEGTSWLPHKRFWPERVPGTRSRERTRAQPGFVRWHLGEHKALPRAEWK